MIYISNLYILITMAIYPFQGADADRIRTKISEKISLLEPVATYHPHLEPKNDHVMRTFNAKFLENDGRSNKAVQTNKFWWNWIVNNSKSPMDRRNPQGLTHPIFPQPYALQWSYQRLGVSHEPQDFVFSKPEVDNNWPEEDGMRSYATTIRHAFQIGATTVMDDDEYSFIKESDTGVHVQLGSGPKKIIFPIFSGMAFVTAKYEGQLTPKFFKGYYFLHGAFMVKNGIFEATYGGPVIGEKMYTVNENGEYVVKPNPIYRFYLINTNGDYADESYEMIAENGELYLNKPFDGYVRVAQVGGYEMKSCEDQCLERLTESAPAILWDVQVDIWDGGVLEYSFIQPDTITETKEILHWAYSTHVSLLSNPGSHNDGIQTQVLNSIKMKPPSKGWMTAVVSNKWSMAADLHKVSKLDFLPVGDVLKDDDTKVNEIKNLAIEQVERFYQDPHRAFNWPYEGHSTYYFGGKGFQKVSMVCLIANQLFGRTDSVVEKCMSILYWGWSCMVDGVENDDGLKVPRWGCGGRPKSMIYDTTWGGTPSSYGYNQNCGADFGNACYNDHHYHYGYWITSASMIAHLSPEMLDNERFKELVNIWIRDTMNPSQHDSFFPKFRSFDLFDLHSWSRGLPHNGDGKDQESTSEEINLYYGIHLWSKVTGNIKLQKLAQTILSLNIATIKEFFLLQRDNPHHPVKYARNHVSGMLFQRSVQFGTWFGLRKEYVHGIQMLPLTPALHLARTRDFCKEEWDDIIKDLLDNGFGGNMVNNQWKSIILTGSQSMLENDTMRDQAYESLRSLPTNEFDDGLTKVWALYWTVSQKYITGTSAPTSTISPSETPTGSPSIDPDTKRYVGDFDSTDEASYIYSSGTYEIATNPDRSDINQSSLSVRYLRSSNFQYDTIAYRIPPISSLDLAKYGNGNKKFCIDAFASTNQRVILQLEDSALSSSNYPVGRQSRYTIDLQSNASWQNYCFQFLDRPDNSTTLVDKIVLLIAPNTFTGDVYYFDNLDAIEGESTTMPTFTPTKIPVFDPTNTPSYTRTNAPSLRPTLKSTLSPSEFPTGSPSENSDTTRFIGDFDSSDEATYIDSSGNYEIATNPKPSNVNKSPFSVRYLRNLNSQYDTIIYRTSTISSLDLEHYVDGTKRFCIDVLVRTNQPLILQLEDSALSSPYNYPTGRHSRYTIDLQSNSSWQNYCFQYLDRPDVSTSLVDTIVLLFAPNTLTGDVYYFDNLDAIGGKGTTMPTFTSTKTSTQHPTNHPSHVPTNKPSLRPTPRATTSPSKFSTGSPSFGAHTIRFVGNFDSTDEASYMYASGSYEIVTNPNRSNINQSPFSVLYSRDSSSQYDTIIYRTSSISKLDLGEYVSGNKRFCIDVLTGVTQRVILQLEDSALSSPYNYPTGRHSRYTIDLQSDSSWQSYCFQYLDRPSASTTLVDTIVLLFAPNTFTGDVYYFDNLDSAI